MGKLLNHQLWERFELEFEFEFAAFDIEFGFECEFEFEFEFELEATDRPELPLLRTPDDRRPAGSRAFAT